MGPSLILLSAVGFGSMALCAKLAFADGMNTASVLALRFVIASALLGSLIALRRSRLPRGRTLGTFFAMGIIYAAMAGAYFSALHYASSAAAALHVDRIRTAETPALGPCSVGLAMVSAGALQGSRLGLVLALRRHERF